MAVPARPVPGNPIAADWGAVAHDTAVAMDIQRGVATPPSNPSGAVSGQLTVVFPRPFAAPPTVILTTENFNWFAGLNGAPPTATSFAFAVFRPAGGSGAGCPTHWVAIGPRA